MTACEVEDVVAKEGNNNEPLPVTITYLAKDLITEREKFARLYRQVRTLCSTRRQQALVITFEILQMVRRKTECLALNTAISSAVLNNTTMNMNNADSMQISLRDLYVIFPGQMS